MRIKLVILSAFACSLFLACCTPVQTRYNIKDKTMANDTTQQTTEQIQPRTQIVVEQKEPEKPIETPAKDTLVIALNTSESTATTDISRANELFESKDYKNALELYRFIISKTETTNPNYWNARFRYEECKIELGKIDEGIEGIEFLLTLIEQNNHIKENFLARFVQILCEKNKKEKAKQYVEILKENFPNSQHIKELETFNCF
jgi:tetratricopeptide (TPR) repeat protein